MANAMQVEIDANLNTNKASVCQQPSKTLKSSCYKYLLNGDLLIIQSSVKTTKVLQKVSRPPFICEPKQLSQ